MKTTPFEMVFIIREICTLNLVTVLVGLLCFKAFHKPAVLLRR